MSRVDDDGGNSLMFDGGGLDAGEIGRVVSAAGSSLDFGGSGVADAATLPLPFDEVAEGSRIVLLLDVLVDGGVGLALDGPASSALSVHKLRAHIGQKGSESENRGGSLRQQRQGHTPRRSGARLWAFDGGIAAAFCGTSKDEPPSATPAARAWRRARSRLPGFALGLVTAGLVLGW